MIAGCMVPEEWSAQNASERTARALGAIGYVIFGMVASARRRRAKNPRPSLILRVERELLASLSIGSPTIVEVASAIGCTRQTLYRQLKALGTSFDEIRTDLLRRHALNLLQVERLSIKEVSYRLGFSEAAAFSRAFKRWTGTCPTKASRQQSRQQS
ncbi:helix-turn-helix domain-containing protein [Sphingomonas jaspsi]|uniref:helix-turn-helix domain-containing protein n=1 Tax=Sphingomonas jaspsi TaxID=392409 RepID=UPI00146FB100|nr:AraC family transcriptional regulator [Sphingomonas jaspsi]